MIELYVDGAYNPGSGLGGWAAVMVEDGRKQAFSGMVSKDATSNRMEIAAALEGILKTLQNAEVKVHTDSQYLWGCMTKGWQRRANLDLLEALDKAVSQRKVQWQLIPPNVKNEFHKEAHNLATSSVSRATIPRPTLEKQKVQQPALVLEPAELTHLDAEGRPRMVDTSAKPETAREAVAKGIVRLKAATLELIRQGKVAKGDVLTVAQLAGIMAAKKTHHLIPLCHPLLLDDVSVSFSLDEKDSTIEITSVVKSTGRTGVEMEALTATAVAALTIYDMCKAVDRGIKIDHIRLVRKSGGKSGLIALE